MRPRIKSLAGNIFSLGIDGTNYQNILSFTGTGGAASGRYPSGILTLSGTTLNGTTAQGGVHGWGNIFSVGIDGSGYDDLYSFTGRTDGTFPQGDLTLSGGTLFGMEPGGGANGDGTVFAIALPAPTPEPCTLALVSAGAVALVSYRWRTRLGPSVLIQRPKTHRCPPPQSGSILTRMFLKYFLLTWLGNGG